MLAETLARFNHMRMGRSIASLYAPLPAQKATWYRLRKTAAHRWLASGNLIDDPTTAAKQRRAAPEDEATPLAMTKPSLTAIPRSEHD